MKADTLTVRVHAYDRDLLRELFESEEPDPTATVTVDGVEATLGGVSQRPGMSSEDIIITILINLGTGVPTSLIAAWIYTRLTRKGQQSVEVGKDPIVKTTEAEILEAVTQSK
jgi:hypothetical protein